MAPPRTSLGRRHPFLDQRRIKPVIDHVYAFEEAVRAYVM